MSSAYYQQKWEEAISELLGCVDQENHPLEENRNDKGVSDPIFRSPTKEQTMNGFNTMENYICGMFRPTENWKMRMIKWSTRRKGF